VLSAAVLRCSLTRAHTRPYRGPAFMRAIEEKQAAKFAKQREHQKAFDKLRKQREYAENVRFKAKEMLDKSV
jgi:hypothetical protein